MSEYDSETQNGSDAQNESDIIEAEDGGEVIPDGGVTAARRSARIPDDEDFLHHTEEAKGNIDSPIGGGWLSTDDYTNAYGRIEILPINDRTVQLAATFKAEVGDREIHVSATPALTPDQAEQLGRELFESALGARMQTEQNNRD